jgi:enoyl-CoA hydratase/carnithine racemase
MSTNELLVEREGFVATLIINRPEKRNTLNPLILLKFATYLDDFAKNDEVRAVIIRGQGDKAFSSGYDITEIPTDVKEEFKELLEYKDPLEIGMGAIENFPYPVIAMIDGYALGMGCDLAMTCDIRIASDTSRMGIPVSKLGILYPPKSVRKFINVIGLANTKEIIFTGRNCTMDKAKEMGMVNYVVPKAELHEFTYAMAEEIAGNAPLAIKGHKYIFNKLLYYQALYPEDLAKIQRMQADSLLSEDLKEGTTAFFEKRKPVFKGR